MNRLFKCCAVLSKESTVKFTETIRNVIVVIAILAGSVWGVFVLKEPLNKSINIRQSELELERSRLEITRLPIMEMDMTVRSAVATSERYALVIVTLSMKNNGELRPIDIDMAGAEIVIRNHLVEGPAIVLNEFVEYGEPPNLVEAIYLEPGGMVQMEIMAAVQKEGVYSVVARVPYPGDGEEFWSVQRFVVVE